MVLLSSLKKFLCGSLQSLLEKKVVASQHISIELWEERRKCSNPQGTTVQPDELGAMSRALEDSQGKIQHSYSSSEFN